MKKYFIKIFVFLIPVVIIGCIMEFLLQHIPNDFRNKKEFLDAKSEQIQVLILGGSHTLYGINPEYLKERSFNACQVSQTLDFDLALLEKYNKKWSDLQFIVLPISYASLFEKLEKSIEPWRIKNYCIYYKMRASSYLPFYTEILSNKLETNIHRLYSFYAKGTGNVFCTETGWDSTYSFCPKDRDFVKEGNIAARLHRWEDDQYFNEMVSSLNSIIILAQKYNAKVILFTPPAFITYRENLNRIQLTRTITTAEKLAKEYNNCFFYNFLEDLTFTEEHFFDADHLNKAGAKKMTLKIDSIIHEIQYFDLIH
jgi:hypothetical protein